MANAHMYEIVGGLRASLLSAVTKFDAGQRGSRNKYAPNILYMMLPCVIYSFSLLYLSKSAE
jgi:hypothetical protein